MDIIDFHIHLWPDKIAQKAKEYLEHSYRRQMTDVPTVNNAIKIMDEVGITKSVIASVASRPEQVEHINNWLFNIKSDRFIKFASLHPFYEKWSYELDRIKDDAMGIKYQPEFQIFLLMIKKSFLYMKKYKNYKFLYYFTVDMN